jgi:microsomal dipeptidase-like Zn-dependent dipeptidase
VLTTLHEEIIVIDGNQINNWDREVFEELSAGGLTCVQATCAVWENARGAMGVLGRWFQMFREHGDLIMHVCSVDDVLTAKETGKVGVVLGFQNTSPVEDDLSLVEVFHRLGVRVMQLTYNIQNHVGASCYEPNDAGLTRFGRAVVHEMNRCGMLVDLSHVGERTSLDAIELSELPVAITHANPAWFYPCPRNKSDTVIGALAERGGVIGCTVYPSFIGGHGTRLGDFCAMVERLVEAIGVEHVAIGTDSTRKCTAEDLSWLRNGRWRFTNGQEPPSWPRWPEWFRSPADFANITGGLLDRGFSRQDVEAVMGGNWSRLFKQTFGPAG